MACSKCHKPCEGSKCDNCKRIKIGPNHWGNPNDPREWRPCDKCEKYYMVLFKHGDERWCADCNGLGARIDKSIAECDIAIKRDEKIAKCVFGGGIIAVITLVLVTLI